MSDEKDRPSRIEKEFACCEQKEEDAEPTTTVFEVFDGLEWDQSQRVAALREAAIVLRGRQMFGTPGVADVDGLIRLSRYIVTGQDPT
jgi:hypothetical protein